MLVLPVLSLLSAIVRPFVVLFALAVAYLGSSSIRYCSLLVGARSAMNLFALCYHLIAYCTGGELYQWLYYVQFCSDGVVSCGYPSTGDDLSMRMVPLLRLIFNPVVVLNYGIICSWSFVLLYACLLLISFRMLCYRLLHCR